MLLLDRKTYLLLVVAFGMVMPLGVQDPVAPTLHSLDAATANHHHPIIPVMPSLVTADANSRSIAKESASVVAAKNFRSVIAENAQQALSRNAIPFVANSGQHDERVAYSANIFAGTLFVTKEGQIVYSLLGTKEANGQTGRWSFTESFVGGTARLSGGSQAVTRVSRFAGSDPQKWQTDMPTYEDVRLGEVWRGVDVRLVARSRNVEKIFTVLPGGDPAVIRMQIAGAGHLAIGRNGELIADTDLGPVTFTAPVAYQDIDGRRHAVQVGYYVVNDRYGFVVGKYDSSKPLVIDPLLQSTYLGGTFGGVNEWISDIAIHPLSGDVYVAGVSQAAMGDFPGTAGGAQPAGSNSAFVARLNASLTTLLQATYYGVGTYSSAGAAIAVTNTDVYVAGDWHPGTDLPGTAGGAIPAALNKAGFVVRLSASLTSIIQATGVIDNAVNASETAIRDILIHPNGDVYVAGKVNVASLPNSAGAFQTDRSGISDAFIMRFNGSLTAIVRSTFLGGSGIENATNLVAKAATGDIYIAGDTSSVKDFPGVTGGAQASPTGSPTGFVSRISADLTTLKQSTYVDDDSGFSKLVGVAVHPFNGEVYVYNKGNIQLLVASLNEALTAFTRTIFFTTGGVNDALGTIHALVIHPLTGEIYITGETHDLNLTGVAGGAQTTLSGGEDSFVARFDAALTQVLQSTYYGGSTPADHAYAITVHPGSGDVYIVGKAFSSNLPRAAGGFQPSLQGASDGFIARFSSDLRAASAATVSVNCASASLQAAVDGALPGSTISVTGTCNESILIRNEKQRLTLDGGGVATINGTSSAAPVVNVRGKGILIQNFTIIGGGNGIHVNRGSNAVIHNNIIQNTGGSGVVVDELSFAVLTNNITRNNAGAGIVVSQSSAARIGFNSDAETVSSGNTIQNNGAGGIIVSSGASARIIGNHIISNTGDGVFVGRDAQSDLAGNAISGNDGDGIEVAENSTLQLGVDSGTGIFEVFNTTTSPNTEFGIRCTDGGSVDGRQGTLIGAGGAASLDGTCSNSLDP
jgi:parallel beta-helix repeat protein